MVELDALGTTELGKDLHDVILLLGREHVFTVMYTIVRTHACAKVRTHALTSFRYFVTWHIVIQITKSPSLLDQFFLAVARAVTLLPGRRIYSLTNMLVLVAGMYDYSLPGNVLFPAWEPVIPTLGMNDSP